LNFISSEMAEVHNASHDKDWSVSRSNLGAMNLNAIEIGETWQALQELKAYARRRPDFPRLSIVPDLDSPEALRIYYREPLTFVGGRNCTDPWTMMMIKTDGTVIPAHGRCYDFPLGNVKETPLSELWNNGRFQTFRQTLKSAGGAMPACARCCGVINKRLRS